MIVQTMTNEEIRRQVLADIAEMKRRFANGVTNDTQVQRWLRTNRNKRFFRVLPSANNNKVLCYAQRDKHDTAYGYQILARQSNGYATYCMRTIGGTDDMLVRYSAHLFSRYRKRMSLDSSLSDIDVIKKFFARNIRYSVFPISNEKGTYVRSACTDGAILGDYKDTFISYNTFITDEMDENDDEYLHDLGKKDIATLESFNLKQMMTLKQYNELPETQRTEEHLNKFKKR